MQQLKCLQSGSEPCRIGPLILTTRLSAGTTCQNPTEISGVIAVYRERWSPKLVLDVLLYHCLNSESNQDSSGLLIVWTCYFLLREKCAFLPFRLLK